MVVSVVRSARALCHDIGKYIARTARNVRDAEWTPELVTMLLADLYDLRGGRALAVFLRLAPAEESPLARLPAWTAAHAALRELDTMEAKLRSRDRLALDQACRLALEVDNCLRQLVCQAEVERDTHEPAS
jgi:hypothetical protein